MDDDGVYAELFGKPHGVASGDGTGRSRDNCDDSVCVYARLAATHDGHWSVPDGAATAAAHLVIPGVQHSDLDSATAYAEALGDRTGLQLLQLRVQVERVHAVRGL